MSRKRVLDFELTLAQSTLSKEHVFFALEDLCDQLLVAREYHSNGGAHYHCYCKLVRKSRADDFTDDVEANIMAVSEGFRESIHTSSLRNAKHWIKYCTKEDTDPLSKNMDEGEFHQSWKLHNYIRHHEQIHGMDTFIRQNPSLYNIIRKLHADYWSRKYEQEPDIWPVQPDMQVRWVLDLKRALEVGNKSVYLHGPSGVGKTTAVKWMTKHTDNVHLPCGTTTWEFGQLESTTTWAIAGDAPDAYVSTHRSAILQVCDKGLVTLNQKCAPIKTIRFKGRLIIVSNFEWTAHEDEALTRRFEIVYAGENGIQKIKEEAETIIPQEVLETIHISSDEETDEEGIRIQLYKTQETRPGYVECRNWTGERDGDEIQPGCSTGLARADRNIGPIPNKRRKNTLSSKNNNLRRRNRHNSKSNEHGMLHVEGLRRSNSGDGLRTGGNEEPIILSSDDEELDCLLQAETDAASTWMDVEWECTSQLETMDGLRNA